MVSTEPLVNSLFTTTQYILGDDSQYSQNSPVYPGLHIHLFSMQVPSKPLILQVVFGEGLQTKHELDCTY